MQCFLSPDVHVNSREHISDFPGIEHLLEKYTDVFLSDLGRSKQIKTELQIQENSLPMFFLQFLFQ